MCSTFVRCSVKVYLASRTKTDDRCLCNHAVDTMTSSAEPRDHVSKKHVTTAVITISSVFMVYVKLSWFTAEENASDVSLVSTTYVFTTRIRNNIHLIVLTAKITINNERNVGAVYPVLHCVSKKVQPLGFHYN